MSSSQSIYSNRCFSRNSARRRAFSFFSVLLSLDKGKSSLPDVRVDHARGFGGFGARVILPANPDPFHVASRLVGSPSGAAVIPRHRRALRRVAIPAVAAAIVMGPHPRWTDVAFPAEATQALAHFAWTDKITSRPSSPLRMPDMLDMVGWSIRYTRPSPNMKQGASVARDSQGRNWPATSKPLCAFATTQQNVTAMTMHAIRTSSPSFTWRPTAWLLLPWPWRRYPPLPPRSVSCPPTRESF